jgi:hypothetical protein
MLWDSQCPLTLHRPARTSLFAGNLEIPWDSHAAQSRLKPKSLKRKSKSDAKKPNKTKGSQTAFCRCGTAVKAKFA